jgi:hypothetical protein
MDFTDTFSKGFICLGLIRLPGTCLAKGVEKTCDLKNVRGRVEEYAHVFRHRGTPKWIAERKRARHDNELHQRTDDLGGKPARLVRRREANCGVGLKAHERHP